MGTTDPLLLHNLRVDELLRVAETEASTPLELALVKAIRDKLAEIEPDDSCACCGGCKNELAADEVRRAIRILEDAL